MTITATLTDISNEAISAFVTKLANDANLPNRAEFDSAPLEWQVAALGIIAKMAGEVKVYKQLMMAYRTLAR